MDWKVLHAWCREKGLFSHQLAQWKVDFCGQSGTSEGREGARERRALQEDNQRLQRELTHKEKALAEAAALLVLPKKYQALLGGGRGRMTTLEERQQVVALVQEATAAGARQEEACVVLGLSVRTLQRWQDGERVRTDQRPLRQYEPPHKLTEAERAEILAVANSDEFGHLPPSQIVPRRADQGRYLASESTFYRVLKAENQ